MTLTDQTATKLLPLLENGEITSAEVTAAFLGRIDEFDASIGAFLRVNHSNAMQQAEAIDKRRAEGKPVGKLAGLPVAVKDILCHRGEKVTCGSKMLQDFVSPYDATVIQKLREADAVFIGRTNMDEFAMGGSTENSAFQKTHNPWKLGNSPGGSSGGAAACVAARMAPLSIGTDTGGSIRQPAGLCGVVGLKPTYGRISRYGLVAFASSLDQIGPITQSVEDAALLLSVLSGHDTHDSTSLDVTVPDFESTVNQPLKGLRIGIVPEHFTEGLHPEVEQAVRTAIEVYQSLGATIREVDLPHGKYAVATYYVIAPSEASSNLSRYDGMHYGYRTDEAALENEEATEYILNKAGGEDTALVKLYRRNRAEAFGPEVKRRIMLGTFALSSGYYDAYYKQALKVRRVIRQDYDAAFEKVDLLLSPVTAQPSYVLGAFENDPLSLYLVDLYTVGANLAGIPGISLPCGFSTKEQSPIGFQLLAPPLQEERLLRGAAMYQSATDWHTRVPDIQS